MVKKLLTSRSVLVWIKVDHWRIGDPSVAFAIYVLFELAPIPRQKGAPVDRTNAFESLVSHVKRFNNTHFATVHRVWAARTSAVQRNTRKSDQTLSGSNRSGIRAGVVSILEFTPRKVFDIVVLEY